MHAAVAEAGPKMRGRRPRVRQDAGLKLKQLRTDAARERDELLAARESRAQVLEELRARAERAERDLDAARAERARP